MHARSHDGPADAWSKEKLSAALISLRKGDHSNHSVAKANNLANTMRRRTSSVKKNHDAMWMENSLARFHRRLHGQKDLAALGKIFFTELLKIVPLDQGRLYVNNVQESLPGLTLLSTHSVADRNALQRQHASVEWIDQCARAKQRILLTQSAGDSVKVLNGRRHRLPVNVLISPISFEEAFIGVLEISTRRGFDSIYQQFFKELTEILGAVLHKIQSDQKTQALLRQSVSLAKELQKQQGRLHETNRELLEKAGELASQKAELENKNRELEQARQNLQEKAAQLALSSKYKSEFLANMSHELRTPLNSLLLLSRELFDNAEKNLTERQLEFAHVIHASGQDLLRLINQSLDLSKIESGTVTLDVGDVPIWNFQQRIERFFRPLAISKKLEFLIQINPTLPTTMQTDDKRLEQILKNLLSNAFKFTDAGRVELKIDHAQSGWNPENPQLQRASSVLEFSVIDTGIGISPEKQKVVFDAFQQGDGSTSRQYGGTGLGLTISRELARLLGGEIQLTSAVGQGSTFSLFLPLNLESSREERAGEKVRNDTPELFPLQEQKNSFDDRDLIKPGDRVLLCVEDDADFGVCLKELAQSHGFKILMTSRGEGVMDLIRKFQPIAITLDLTLPDIDGWKILERLKTNLETRHIPVAVISAESECLRGAKLGAAIFLVKPVKLSVLENVFEKLKSFHLPPRKKFLLAQPEGPQQTQFLEWLSQSNLQISSVKSSRTALTLLKSEPFDCVAVDLRLPDNGAFQLLEKIGKAGFFDLPVLVCRNGEMRAREESKLHRVTRGLFVKEVHSLERLLDETTLFLHVKMADLPEMARTALEKLHLSNSVLEGKRALVVDDDIRNVFAMTSLLERHGMEIVSTESGREAVEMLRGGTQPDLALMDIMMPDFDGYQTIRAIRQLDSFKSLPIIAVTAKAMKEDRTRCLQAGASDYVTKPVDPEQLLATLRLWLYR